ncbi:hypothetical protein SN4111_01660 [Ligilactobacillus agilis]|nr:hypothetical protein SN4111_01660 [Ligilactobacillus agilis]
MNKINAGSLNLPANFSAKTASKITNAPKKTLVAIKFTIPKIDSLLSITLLLTFFKATCLGYNLSKKL